MSARPEDRKSFQMAVILLAVAGLVLGLRAFGAMQGVARARARVATTETVPADVAADHGDASRADSLLALSPGGTDPFLERRVPLEPVPAGMRPRPTAVDAQSTTVHASGDTRPQLRAVIFDMNDPAIQIRVDGKDSGWLHVGDAFRDYRIVEIKPGSARIVGDEGTFTVRSP
jgi:hypothetical protein